MNKKTEAQCSGPMLTVGFHSAHPPLIWRFDLERNHSFTLSLQGEDGEWELGVTSPKGDFYPVAHFTSREDGEEALLKVEKILARKAKKTCRSSVTITALATVGILAILVAGGVVLFGLSVKYLPKSQTETSSAIQPQRGMPPAGPPEGIPLSADDILKAPQ